MSLCKQTKLIQTIQRKQADLLWVGWHIYPPSATTLSSSFNVQPVIWGTSLKSTQKTFGGHSRLYFQSALYVRRPITGWRTGLHNIHRHFRPTNMFLKRCHWFTGLRLLWRWVCCSDRSVRSGRNESCVLVCVGADVPAPLSREEAQTARVLGGGVCSNTTGPCLNLAVVYWV